MFVRGTVNRMVMSSPDRVATISVGGLGSLTSGGSGGPFLPHAAARTEAVTRQAIAARRGRLVVAVTPIGTDGSQDVSRQVVVGDDVFEHAADVGVVNRNRFVGEVGRVERYLVEQPLHHRVQPARTDVLGVLVDVRRNLRDVLHGIVGEPNLHAFRVEQRRVLLDERAARLGQDADELGRAEWLELDAYGKASLQLRDEVRRLRHVKGASGDEENVIRLHHAVFRVDGGAFDDGQDVALDAFAAHVRSAVPAFPSGNLVDLVDEDDAALLDALDGAARHAVHVDQLLFFFLGEDLERFGHLELAAARSPLKHAGQHLFQVDADFL